MPYFLFFAMKIAVIIGSFLILLWTILSIGTYSYWIVAGLKAHIGTAALSLAILTALCSVILERKGIEPVILGIDVISFLNAIAAFLFLIGLLLVMVIA